MSSLPSCRLNPFPQVQEQATITGPESPGLVYSPTVYTVNRSAQLETVTNGCAVGTSFISGCCDIVGTYSILGCCGHLQYIAPSGNSDASTPPGADHCIVLCNTSYVNCMSNVLCNTSSGGKRNASTGRRNAGISGELCT